MFVISGATGHTGSIVAQTLLDQGHPVRVIVRSAEKGAPWRAKGAEVAIADLGDCAALVGALQGAHGAYFLLPPDVTHADFIGQSQKRAEAIAQAAARVRLPHAVLLSSVGADQRAGVGPIATVGALERHLVAAGVPLTAVRPGYFLENIMDVMPVVRDAGVYPSMILPLDRRIDMVATRDIGLTVAQALVKPPQVAHRVIDLRGAAQYSAVDVATALSQALARPIVAVPVPQDHWVDTLKQTGVSEQAAGSLAEMHEAIAAGRLDFQDPNSPGETVRSREHTVRHATIGLADFLEGALEVFAF